jgi:hypothetical protein
MRFGLFTSEGHVAHDQHSHDFVNREVESRSHQRFPKHEITKRSQSLIKGDIWTFGSSFHDFVSWESRRVSPKTSRHEKSQNN